MYHINTDFGIHLSYSMLHVSKKTSIVPPLFQSSANPEALVICGHASIQHIPTICGAITFHPTIVLAPINS
jgi:hypothetical protein